MNQFGRTIAFLTCSSVLTLAFCLSPTHAFAQAGNSGLAFLKLGVSGRAVSLGDAMTGHATGATAIHYNPAGILSTASGSAEFLLMHKEWMQDVRAEFFGAAFQLSEQRALGVSIATATVSDIPIRTRPGPVEGTFTARDFAFGLSYAQSLSDDLKIGLTGKYLFERIFLEEAGGVAFDVGAQYKTPIDNLNAGISFSNLGSMSTLRNESIKLPALTRFGAAYTVELEEVNSNVILATDLLYVFPEKRAYINLGGEFLFDSKVAARSGYQFGSEGRGFSAGIGVKHDMFVLDYGFAPLAVGLGSGHTFSIVLTF